MDLLTYVRALRRRWLLIVACVVVGAVVGYASTLLRSEHSAKKGRTYYAGTVTTLVDYGTDNVLRPAYSNLDQIALVTTDGDVPQRVVDTLELDDDAGDLAEHVVTTTDSTTATLAISVADPDRARAVKLADAFAVALDESLQATDQQRYDTYVANLKQKTDDLRRAGDDLLAKLRTFPPDSDTIQEQYDATRSQYQTKYSLLLAAQAGGAATTSVTVLQNAEADPINAAEYATRLRLGAAGTNHLNASGGADTAAALSTGTSSSSFNSGFGRAFAGGFLGLLVGIGIALALERFDRRMRTRQEVEAAFQLPVLADVPQLSRKDQADDQLVAFSAPLSRVAEAFRAVRTALVFQQSMSAASSGSNGTTHGASNGHANGNGNGNGNGAAPHADDTVDEPLVVMVTSAAPREGKSTTSANLAVAFAESGQAVLVVNCDFRRPTIHRRFGVFDEPRRVQDTKVPGVKIVTNVLADASANPSQVVAAQRQVIAAARGRFDVIILDTAPMLTANDAVGIVNVVDLVLLVAQLDMTTSDNAHRVMELLSRVHASVAGVVLIGSSDTSNEYYYYYYQRGRVANRDGGAKPAEADAPRDIFGDTETTST